MADSRKAGDYQNLNSSNRMNLFMGQIKIKVFGTDVGPQMLALSAVQYILTLAISTLSITLKMQIQQN